MAGPFHDFLLLSRIDYDYTDYMKLINNRHALRIHDNLIHYIADTLRWITCYNPAKKGLPKHKGLNLYGPTIIKSDGAEAAWKVFRAWADLFSIGPKEIELKGYYILDEGEGGLEVVEERGGQYEKLSFKRDEIMRQFKKVASYCREVSEGGEEVFLLHLGV